MSASRYPSIHSLQNTTGITQVAAYIIKMGGGGIAFEKGQAGASDYAHSLFAETSQNPIIRDSIGLLVKTSSVPSLPTLPPSATVLKYLWPRLKKNINPSDPLYLTCEAGANGDNVQAQLCYSQWLNERVPTLQAQLSATRTVMWQALPNLDDNGIPASGSYYHETDFTDSEWRQSLWGDAHYANLYAIKQRYDPKGLFICHHCVGSEDWDATGTCKL